MITGEIKNQIDQIWDTFFVAGVTNPITVLEQMTYIFFMKMLDDKQLQEEDNARDFDGEVKNPTFPAGKMWLNPDTNQEVPYESMRWSVFRNTGSENMYNMIRQNVFEFIKHIGTGEEGAYSRYMKTAIFLIPNARTLTKIVDGVDELHDGSHKLADGIVEFDEDGISKIVNSYEGDIKPLTDRLQAVLDAGEDYQTFTSVADGVNGSVKFIYKLDSIKADDAK